MKRLEVNRDIIDNSYYMIYLFQNASDDNNKGKNISITNLKLQKLMYFVEAYYMCENQEEKRLFDTEWNAWDYGPVNKYLYNNYKVFGSMELLITEKERIVAEKLPEINRKYIDKIYSLFGNLSAFGLVTLTHLPNSPWSKIYEKNKELKKYNFQILNDSKIPKDRTRDWFLVQFDFLFKDSEEK